jgi:tetratricopeptide (TPR) repeat protein
MTSSLQQGINAAKAGQMQKALAFLKDAIIEEPQNADVWVWIAAIIDDLNKQEIFLEKALEIDPNNIPAQRGLAYLQKRKQDEQRAKNEHLSDHTQPISPFPPSQRPKIEENNGGWTKISEDELREIAHSHAVKPTASKEKIAPKDEIPSQKLTTFEFTLLGIVVVVFCFIGLLAASAIFEFELPLGFLWGNKPQLTMEPPYQGVFLYENGVFFDIQQYQGIPTSDNGMPTSFDDQPVIVFWETGYDPENFNLIFQNGAYVPFTAYEGKSDSDLLQPENKIEPGLYCLQQPDPVSNEDSLFWCFKVALLPPMD